MSTYVMSDCHGRYDKFLKMLETIRFSKDDTLYVLGDVIDRNENGIDILLYIMEQPNMHFIIGNHEDMFYKTVVNKHLVLSEDNRFLSNEDIRLWFRNGGEVTARDFLSRSKDVQDDIIRYLESCDIVVPDLMVGDKSFYLVHAFPDLEIESLNYVDNIGKYSLVQVLWERFYELVMDLPMSMVLERFFPKDKIVISGHTVAKKLHYYLGNYTTHLPDGLYKHFNEDGNLIFLDIDCGCAITDKEQQVLCCLRLDDMEEFYV